MLPTNRLVCKFFLTLQLIFTTKTVGASGVARDLAADNIPTLRDFFGDLDEMPEEVFIDMIQDLLTTIAATCNTQTEFSYWVCNQYDMFGTLLDPDGYKFVNLTQFPDRNVTVSQTREGAYIQGLLGAFLTQKLHFYRLRRQNVCGVDTGDLIAEENRSEMHRCVKDDLKRVGALFKVFVRKYSKKNPLTADLLHHNLFAGHKLFMDIVEDEKTTPCPCVTQDKCASLSFTCYNHNLIHDLPSMMGSQLYHWSLEGRKAVPYDHKTKRLYYEESNKEKIKIGYKRLAYISDYEKNCQTVVGRKCVRSKSYEICQPQFKDNTSWYQRYLKKSCPRLCGECGLDSSEDLDAPPSPHFCADEIPLQYKCTQPV